MTQEVIDIKQYDVVIVGGAMIGAILALVLAQLEQSQSPLKIALIERALPKRDSTQARVQNADQGLSHHSGFDARTIAIAQANVLQLQQWQLWHLFAPHAHAIEHIHVSDQGHFGMVQMSAAQASHHAFGQVVSLSQVGQALHQTLQHRSLDYFCPETITELQPLLTGHQLTLSSGQQLQTKLLIAADGAQSFIRQQLQLPLQHYDFQQSGIFCTVSVEKTDLTDISATRAWERFTTTGPIALLPAGDSDSHRHLALVWAMATDKAEQFATLEEKEFLLQLQQAFGYRAGRFVNATERNLLPLSMSVMPRPLYHRCLFIGNAAQTLHPIAGQGFNLGLRDVADLVSMIKRAFASDLNKTAIDLGQAKWLHQYLQARQSDRNQTIAGIEQLLQGFAHQAPLITLGRNLGLRLLAWFPPLQAPLIHRAMGWRKDVKRMTGSNA